MKLCWQQCLLIKWHSDVNETSEVSGNFRSLEIIETNIQYMRSIMIMRNSFSIRMILETLNLPFEVEFWFNDPRLYVDILAFFH